MIWRILPHATVCIASDRLILLDIRRDRYLRIPSAHAPRMRAWLEGPSASAPAQIARMLVDNGIARAGDLPPTNTARETVRLPTELLSPTWQTAGARIERRSVAIAQIVTRLRLRSQPLATILRDHTHVETSRPPVDPVHLRNRCAIFARSRAFSPFRRNCLLDSLSLDHWLGDDARDCRLVFGVTAHPFTAHCWLQSRQAVLNDSYDHVARHTPILII